MSFFWKYSNLIRLPEFLWKKQGNMSTTLFTWIHLIIHVLEWPLPCQNDPSSVTMPPALLESPWLKPTTPQSHYYFIKYMYIYAFHLEKCSTFFSHSSLLYAISVVKYFCIKCVKSNNEHCIVVGFYLIRCMDKSKDGWMDKWMHKYICVIV